MSYCSKCGARVGEQSAFCPQCGQPQSSSQGTAPAAASGQAGLTENVAGLLCYVLGWITGLIFFLVEKRPYVRFHAAQAVVVFGALHVLSMVFGIAFGLGWMFGGPFSWRSFSVGFVLHRAIELVGLILWIVCMIKAYQGERFKVPIAGDVAESLAGK